MTPPTLDDARPTRPQRVLFVRLELDGENTMLKIGTIPVLEMDGSPEGAREARATVAALLRMCADDLERLEPTVTSCTEAEAAEGLAL